ncbi:MAG TPA: SAM-dependent methyltransferase [Chitinophagaceae bacterium]|jgi:16S rRNA (cytidine1402-2'-O)-methyltransferase|nr:SAM-dependent methyltransferase [Chitinophagaceae bacterium]
MTLGKVYLLPMLLHEEGFDSMPSDVLTWIQQCDAFFVENEKTARRYFKKLWKEMVIDDYTWHAIHKVENEQIHAFSQLLKQGKNIGILSEAGCAGIADPGQILVAAAQELGAIVKPYTGPSSLLLALMGSGMNGQNFHFHGYLPIDALERKKKIQALEADIKQTGVTQLFIETPYRNNQLFEAITQNCHPNTKLCVAMELTGPNEWIKTQSVANWKNSKPELHKKLVVFLLGA